MKVLFLDDLVKAGSALWFDKSQRSALVLWRSIPEWADAIYSWARSNGLEDSVVTVDEMQASWCWGARHHCLAAPSWGLRLVSAAVVGLHSAVRGQLFPPALPTPCFPWPTDVCGCGRHEP